MHPPALPPGVRFYVIGDVHGRIDLLDDLLARIDIDQRRRPGPRPVHIFLGDYIDRGPGSREVLDLLMTRRADGAEMVFLKGNHEEFMLEFLSNAAILDDW